MLLGDQDLLDLEVVGEIEVEGDLLGEVGVDFHVFVGRWSCGGEGLGGRGGSFDYDLVGHDFLDNLLDYYLFLYDDLLFYHDLLLDDDFLLYEDRLLYEDGLLHYDFFIDYNLLLDEYLFFHNNLFLHPHLNLYRHFHEHILLLDDDDFLLYHHWDLYDQLTRFPLALVRFLLDVVFLVDEDGTHAAHHETLMVLPLSWPI